MDSTWLLMREEELSPASLQLPWEEAGRRRRHHRPDPVGEGSPPPSVGFRHGPDGVPTERTCHLPTSPPLPSLVAICTLRSSKKVKLYVDIQNETWKQWQNNEEKKRDLHQICYHDTSSQSEK